MPAGSEMGAGGPSDVSGGGASSAANGADLTDPEAYSELKEATALLQYQPDGRGALVRTMAASAQWHIFRGQWQGAGLWLELALTAGGNGLPQAQANQLMMTQAFVALQRLTNAPAASAPGRGRQPQ